MKTKNINPILLTDIDGVSINWLQGYINYMESKGYKALHDEPEHFTMIDIFPQLEKPYQFVRQYHHSSFYDNVPAYKEAFWGYNTLHKMGVKIVAVTSCGNEDRVIKSRMNSISNHFGNIFDTIHTLDVGQDKYDILSQYDCGIFVDDQMNNVISGQKAGHLSCLWNMSYNKKEKLSEGMMRAYSWQDVVSCFQKILENKNSIYSNVKIA